MELRQDEEFIFCQYLNNATEADATQLLLYTPLSQFCCFSMKKKRLHTHALAVHSAAFSHVLAVLDKSSQAMRRAQLTWEHLNYEHQTLGI